MDIHSFAHTILFGTSLEDKLVALDSALVEDETLSRFGSEISGAPVQSSQHQGEGDVSCSSQAS
jgi:hypothetical protein